MKKWEQYDIIDQDQLLTSAPPRQHRNRSLSRRIGLRAIRNYIIVYILGGLYYCFLEALWRGYTHWTMAVTGGACFLGLFFISVLGRGKPMILQCLAGSVLITAIELCAGSIVNLLLRWNVWDYSSLRFHFMGQICLLFSVVWFFLCIPGIKLCRILYALLFDDPDNPHMEKGSDFHEAQIR